MADLTFLKTLSDLASEPRSAGDDKLAEPQCAAILFDLYRLASYPYGEHREGLVQFIDKLNADYERFCENQDL